MFRSVSAFNQPIRCYKYGKYVSKMLQSFNLPIGNWDTSAVTSMAHCFNQLMHLINQSEVGTQAMY